MSFSKRLTLAAIIVVGLGLVGVLAFGGPAPTAGQANIPCYRAQGGAQYVAGSGCEYQFESGATLEAQRGSIVSLGGSVLGPLQTPIAVVYQTPFAPTGFNQPIIAQTATAVVSFTVPSAPGIYVITNVGGANITLDDAGNTVMAGDFAMGQYDAAWFYSDGTRMIELGRSNN